MKKFEIVFSITVSKSSSSKRRFVIDSQDEATAYTWVDKQRPLLHDYISSKAKISVKEFLNEEDENKEIINKEKVHKVRKV